MLIRKVSEVLVRDEHNEMLLNMHANRSKYLYENRHAPMTYDLFLKTTEFVQANLGWDITQEQVEDILNLYPQARIEIAVTGGVNDTDVRDCVLNAFAHFFLGCDWVTYGDKVDLSVFLQAIHKQAVKMGFTH
jgi:3-keto-L-gulonate-6-phosphate decarboxylase